MGEGRVVGGWLGGVDLKEMGGGGGKMRGGGGGRVDYGFILVGCWMGGSKGLEVFLGRVYGGVIE